MSQGIASGTKNDIFVEPADFSATVESACSSEEMLYEVYSDSIYDEKQNTKKTVKFGNVFIEDKILTVDYNCTPQKGQNALFSMFLDNQTVNNSSKETLQNSTKTGYSSEEEPLEEPINTYYQEDYSTNVNSSIADSNRLNNFNDEILPGSNNKMEHHQFNSINKTKNEKIDDNSTSNKMKNEHRNLDSNFIIYKPKTNSTEFIKQTGNILQKVRSEKQKKILKKEKGLKLLNQELSEQVRGLQNCVNIQQLTINNYLALVKDKHNDVKKLREEYGCIFEENKILNEKLETMTKQFENARIELDVLSQLKKIDCFSITVKEKEVNNSFYSMESFKTMKNIIGGLQNQNDFLKAVFLLLTKKVNEMHRYTIAPALHLVNEEYESSDELISFSFNNTIQGFIDSKFSVFEELQDLAMAPAQKEMDAADCKVIQEKALEKMDEYFENLRNLFSEQLEKLIRQKLQF